MQRSRIEWCDYSINPVKGLCPVGCSYCYARRMYLNPYYKNMYEHPEIRYEKSVWELVEKIPKPSKIFVGSTIDLFHPDCSQWNDVIFNECEQYPQHTFIFLTKQLQNLAKWSPFPDNCWVGVSATNPDMFDNAFRQLITIEAKVKFISLEPLLDWTHIINLKIPLCKINWLIIGQQTPVSQKTQPQIEWIREIAAAADETKIPIFLKNNLNTLLPQEKLYYTRDESVCEVCEAGDPCGYCGDGVHLRQEFPK